MNLRLGYPKLLDVNMTGKKGDDGGDWRISGDVEFEKGWSADLTQELSPEVRRHLEQ
jgi:hypothetical protein